MQSTFGLLVMTLGAIAPALSGWLMARQRVRVTVVIFIVPVVIAALVSAFSRQIRAVRGLRSGSPGRCDVPGAPPGRWRSTWGR
ncbi:hypothetical protein [Aestuariimicrobium ganziense]|uniref:hypothetical protein n=1 Tax=Aestuariimicrobium ganziense TaxID=2773677 RepID=UPI001940492C|nr:hypothetical protein [Aestuariimicrobium ganziense]